MEIENRNRVSDPISYIPADQVEQSVFLSKGSGKIEDRKLTLCESIHSWLHNGLLSTSTSSFDQHDCSN